MTKFTKEQLITRAKMRLAMVAGFPESQLVQMDKCLAEIALERLTAPVEPVVPDGYVLVPAEPTEDMVIAGFEAELRGEFRDPEAYEAMSGCEQAAHRAKLCWAAMIAAAPKQEADNG
ncbi:hypothetical protein M2354_002052 [Leclercia adecarboxylata]|uniref:hypothetical protein n=1 Tax=Leclercia adecarboxylata TaxID=83655 RepID=UPI0024752C58|nr:hypothetical protein [Leclercia adecarboxylata]MDH6162397.1 hypothetical protein [Leclercia adecarboxylata]